MPAGPRRVAPTHPRRGMNHSCLRRLWSKAPSVFTKILPGRQGQSSSEVASSYLPATSVLPEATLRGRGLGLRGRGDGGDEREQGQRNPLERHLRLGLDRLGDRESPAATLLLPQTVGAVRERRFAQEPLRHHHHVAGQRNRLAEDRPLDDDHHRTLRLAHARDGRHRVDQWHGSAATGRNDDRTLLLVLGHSFILRPPCYADCQVYTNQCTPMVAEGTLCVPHHRTGVSISYYIILSIPSKKKASG